MRSSTKLQLIGTFLMVKVCSTIETSEQRLVKSIFDNYNKKLRPVKNTADVTNVTLDPALYSVVQTDEAAESITILLWFGMIWNDPFLKWNSSEFGGLQQLFIPISDIWYPDIMIYNIIDIVTPIPDEKNNAIINEDGTVFISIVQLQTVHCKFHIAMFPFDIQNCTMDFSSWMHSGDKIDIFYKVTTDMSAFHPNFEWALISITARKRTDYDTDFSAMWPNVYYDILIQRKPTYYLLTFVLPCFMITTISIIGIFAPFNDAGGREEKVSMGLTTLLTMSVILTLIADKMPKSDDGLPLLGTFIVLQIGIGAVSSLVAVVVMYEHRKWTLGEPVPAWIYTVIRLNHQKHNTRSRIIDKVDCVSDYAFTKTNNVQTTILSEIQSTFSQIIKHFYEKSEEKDLRKDWQCVCHRLDLILMFVFLFINSIVTVVLLIIGYSNLRI